jgi:predicted ATP-dependent protease
MKDLVDVPKKVKSDMRLIPVEVMDEVLEVALAPAEAKPAKPKKARTARKVVEDAAPNPEDQKRPEEAPPKRSKKPPASPPANSPSVQPTL